MAYGFQLATHSLSQGIPSYWFPSFTLGAAIRMCCCYFRIVDLEKAWGGSSSFETPVLKQV